MKIEQFVYGRVAHGLRSGGGYQTAAVSRGIELSLQDQLRQISYYPRCSVRSGLRPRYACCCLDGQWLSLSRTVMASDLEGAVGYFSHHLVMSLDDVRRQGWLPWRLLREHVFYAQEADLPASRQLNTLDAEVGPPDAPARDGADFPRILRVARAVSDPSRVTVPVLVSGAQSDGEVLQFVERVLALYPLRMALNLSFCTFFVGSAENLAYYRLVTVPEEADLPQPLENFELLSPEEPAGRAPSPFFEWLEASSVPPADLQRYLILCSGCSEATEAARCEALEDARFDALPAVLEHQWPDWVRDDLMEYPKRFGLYYDRVPSWRGGAIAQEFARRPQRVGEAILALSRHPDARGNLAAWLLDVVVAQPDAALPLLRWADEVGLIDDLARHVVYRGPGDVERLAHAISAANPASPAVHRAIARSVLSGRFGSDAEAQLARWLARPDNRRRCPGTASLIDALQITFSGRVLKYPLDFDLIDADDYERFADRLSQSFTLRRTPSPEALGLLFNPRKPRDSLQMALEAFTHSRDVRHIVQAERRLTLSPRDRDRIIDTLVARPGNRAAAKQYFAWIESQGAGLTSRQRERLDSMAHAGWMQRLKDAFSPW